MIKKKLQILTFKKLEPTYLPERAAVVGNSLSLNGQTGHLIYSSGMESKTEAGSASVTSEELAAIEDEEVLNKMVSRWFVTLTLWKNQLEIDWTRRQTSCKRRYKSLEGVKGLTDSNIWKCIEL